jgi:hypothetical protein
MDIKKALKRDNKISKRRNGHQEDGRSVFAIKEEQRKRAQRIRTEREIKDKLVQGE